jgi:hypothetical protein
VEEVEEEEEEVVEVVEPLPLGTKTYATALPFTAALHCTVSSPPPPAAALQGTAPRATPWALTAVQFPLLLLLLPPPSGSTSRGPSGPRLWYRHTPLPPPQAQFLSSATK